MVTDYGFHNLGEGRSALPDEREFRPQGIPRPNRAVHPAPDEELEAAFFLLLLLHDLGDAFSTNSGILGSFCRHRRSYRRGPSLILQVPPSAGCLQAAPRCPRSRGICPSRAPARVSCLRPCPTISRRSAARWQRPPVSSSGRRRTFGEASALSSDGIADGGGPVKLRRRRDSTTGTYRPYGLDCSGFVDWAFYNASGGSCVVGHGAGATMQQS